MIGEDTINAEIEEGRKLAVKIPERRGIGPGARCGGKEGVLGTKGPGMHQKPRGVGVGDERGWLSQRPVLCVGDEHVLARADGPRIRPDLGEAAGARRSA